MPNFWSSADRLRQSDGIVSRPKRYAKAFPLLAGIVHGGIGVALIALLASSQAENRLFASIATNAFRHSRPRTLIDSVRALTDAASVLTRTANAYTASPRIPESLKGRILPSADYQLFGSGGCGSASLVAARLLTGVNVPVRILQMRCGETWGCHIAIEARVGGRWVAVDPWFDLTYPRSDGTLASAADLRTTFDQYSSILPANYPRAYRYEEVRYSNWSRLPLVGPAIRDGLRAGGLASVDSISIRVHFLNTYAVLAWILGATWAALIGVTFRALRKQPAAATAPAA